jgi:hypothetical protein
LKVHRADPGLIKDQGNSLNELPSGAVEKTIADLIRVQPGFTERSLKIVLRVSIVLLKLLQRLAGFYLAPSHQLRRPGAGCACAPHCLRCVLRECLLRQPLKR